MKHLMLLFLLFSFAFSSQAKKRYSGYFLDQEFLENSKIHEVYKELGVKTVATNLTDRKGRTTRMIQTFGKDGRLVSTTKLNRKGEQISIYTQTFNAYGKLEKTELKSNKKSVVSHYEYSENQKLVYHEIQTNGKTLSLHELK